MSDSRAPRADCGPARRGLGGFIRGFVYAARGIATVLRTERNLRVHTLASYVALSAAFAEPITVTGRAIIVLTVVTVLAAELGNSALERAIDRQGTERDRLARDAKDAAAGAVLCLAAGAVVIAGLLLWPDLGEAWHGLTRHSDPAGIFWGVGFLILVVGVFLPRANGGQGRHD